MAIGISKEKMQLLYDSWKDNIAPSVCPGFIDDDWNAKLISNFIHASRGGDFTFENITQAVQDPYTETRLHIKSQAMTAAEIAAKAAAEKAARERLQLEESNQAVVASWLKNNAPLGLIFDGDMFKTDQEKFVAYIVRNYPGQPLTGEILNEVFLTMGESAFTWFSKKPEDRILRNIPVKVKKLSRQAQIDAGMISDPSRRQTHADDKPIVSMQEAVLSAKEVVRKKLGIPTEDEHWMTKADAISVTTSQGRFDHVRTKELREIFVYKNGKLDGKLTYDARWKAADAVERSKNRG